MLCTFAECVLQRREGRLPCHAAVRVEYKHREVIEAAGDTETATRCHLRMVAADTSRSADFGNTAAVERIMAGGWRD